MLVGKGERTDQKKKVHFFFWKTKKHEKAETFFFHFEQKDKKIKKKGISFFLSKKKPQKMFTNIPKDLLVTVVYRLRQKSNDEDDENENIETTAEKETLDEEATSKEETPVEEETPAEEAKPEKATDNGVLKFIEHVFVHELVETIRTIPMDEKKILCKIMTIGFRDNDQYIEAVYSKLSNAFDPFVISDQVLQCGFLQNEFLQPQTPAQECKCLLRAIIKAKKVQENKKIEQAVAQAFKEKVQKPHLVALPLQLRVPVTNDDVLAWIREH